MRGGAWQSQGGHCSCTRVQWRPNSRLQKPCARPVDMGAKGLQDGIPAVGTRLGANSPRLHPTTRPVSFFPLHQPRWPLFYRSDLGRSKRIP